MLNKVPADKRAVLARNISAYLASPGINSGSPASATANPKRGAALYEDRGCIACHRFTEVIDEADGLNLLESVSGNYGMQLISNEDAKAGKSVHDPKVDQIKVLFDKATPAEQMEVLAYVVEHTGSTLTDGFGSPADDEDGADGIDDIGPTALDIPANLDRRPKK